MTDPIQPSLNLTTDQQPQTVEEYQFEPIKGYPMLHWRGKRPFTSTRFYPAQLEEVHGQPTDGWMNRIYWGDNLQVMSHLLREFRGKVQLVYIDPPFDSKAEYKLTIKLRGKSVTSDRSSFEEKQYTDIWTNDEYLQFMYERLTLIRELIHEQGLIALHCNWGKAHLLRCVLDEVFGAANFRGEALIRAGTKNVQAQFETVSSLTQGHNSIFLYSKSTGTHLPKLLAQLHAPQPGKWDTFWRGTDRPTMRYFLLGHIPSTGQWRWKKERAEAAVQSYDTYLTKYVSKLSLDEYYLQELEYGSDIDFVRLSEDGVVQYYVPPRGYKVLSNVWFDLKYRGTRTDYPTEKHEEIVERLLSWFTTEGDIALDCFMGGGTTQAVAMKLGRRFIGADINLGAIQITTKRLIGIARELQDTQPKQRSLLEVAEEESAEPTTFYTGFEVYNVNNYDIFRNPVEARDLLLEALEVNRLPPGHTFDGEKDGFMVKVMPVNRIATRQDLNDLIANFDYHAFQQRHAAHPNQPVERIRLVCMGHEPDLAALLKQQVAPYTLEVEVVDILRDKSELTFKRDSEADVAVENGHVVIRRFYPMNLLGKLSMQKEKVDDWRELVESVMIDFNYDGAVLTPAAVDIPNGDELVRGRYPIPPDAGTIRLKITDLLSESLEVEVEAPNG